MFHPQQISHGAWLIGREVKLIKMFSFLTDWHSVCQFSCVWWINLLSILKVNMLPPDIKINFVSHYVSTKVRLSSEWMYPFCLDYSEWNLSLCRSRKTAPFAQQTSLVLACHMTNDGAFGVFLRANNHFNAHDNKLSSEIIFNFSMKVLSLYFSLNISKKQCQCHVSYFWHSSKAKTWGWSSSDMVTTACLVKAPCRLWSTVYLLMLEVVELVQ